MAERHFFYVRYQNILHAQMKLRLDQSPMQLRCMTLLLPLEASIIVPSPIAIPTWPRNTIISPLCREDREVTLV